MTPAEALSEIRRSAGHQFDPDLVELFTAEVAPGTAEARTGRETRIPS
jgi:HD-GYP domain-containing protein (c-di-GMP phosphodiesterase class II)